MTRLINYVVLRLLTYRYVHVPLLNINRTRDDARYTARMMAGIHTLNTVTTVEYIFGRKDLLVPDKF